jgi:hypothetical protein
MTNELDLNIDELKAELRNAHPDERRARSRRNSTWRWPNARFSWRSRKSASASSLPSEGGFAAGSTGASGLKLRFASCDRQKAQGFFLKSSSPVRRGVLAGNAVLVRIRASASFSEV